MVQPEVLVHIRSLLPHYVSASTWRFTPFFELICYRLVINIRTNKSNYKFVFAAVPIKYADLLFK